MYERADRVLPVCGIFLGYSKSWKASKSHNRFKFNSNCHHWFYSKYYKFKDSSLEKILHMGDKKSDTKKILLSKPKLAQGGREGGKIHPGRWGREEGKIHPCAAILHPLLVKVFKSETTSFYSFSPRIPNLNFWPPTLGRGGQKTFKQYLKREQTDTRTHGHTDRHFDL